MSAESLPYQQFLTAEIASLQEAIAARGVGATIHNLSPPITALLAREGRIHTTGEPRVYATFPALRQETSVLRVHNGIADSLNKFAGAQVEYQDIVRSGRLGSYLAGLFGVVTEVEADNVYTADRIVRDDGLDGVATAERMFLTTPSVTDANYLGDALQMLLRAPYRFYGVRTQGKKIEIAGMEEHAARSVDRAIGSLVAQEDARKGWVLPPYKRSYARWLELGETFALLLGGRLLENDNRYQILKQHTGANYVGYPNLRPTGSEHQLGSDVAAAMKAMRDIFNALIDQELGGDAHKLEQHPNRFLRLFLDAGAELARQPIDPNEEYEGPGSPRILTPTERLILLGRGALQQATSDPGHATLVLAGKAIGGLQDFGVGVLEHAVPAVTRGGKLLSADLEEWKNRKLHAEVIGRRIDEILDYRLVELRIYERQLRG